MLVNLFTYWPSLFKQATLALPYEFELVKRFTKSECKSDDNAENVCDDKANTYSLNDELDDGD